MTHPNLILTPRKSALLSGHDNTLDVLVRIQVPERPAGEAPARRPLNLALVIDRSGSMSGRPLAEAKRCAEFVIDGLLPTDRASLVVYDDSVDTLVGAMKLSERESLRTAIRGIESGGSTNLHGGWLRGAETLAPHTAADTLSRVILLSDGCANAGLCRTAAIAAQCRELAVTGVTTSTYGLGSNFNEELMVAMAQAGQGNHYYGQTAEDLMDPFREELALLNALFGRNVRLELAAIDGARVELLNSFERAADGTWNLPNLAFGAETWALVRVHLPAGVVAAIGAAKAPLLTATVRYDDLAGEPRGIRPSGLTLEALPAAAYGAVAEEDLVRRRAEEIDAARMQQEAREAALKGDWAAVEILLARVEAMGADNEWIRAVCGELRDLAAMKDRVLFAKEATYSQQRMMMRLASLNEAGLSVNDEVPAFLRRKAAQGKKDPRTPRDQR